MGLVAVAPCGWAAKPALWLGRLSPVFDGAVFNRFGLGLLPPCARQPAPCLGQAAHCLAVRGFAGWRVGRCLEKKQPFDGARAGCGSGMQRRLVACYRAGRRWRFAPLLLLQGLPLVLIPVWQWAHGAPRADRLAFAGAVLLYVLAKFAELADHQIAAITGGLTGHTAKHLLATVAAALIVARLVRRSACVTNAGCKALPCVS